MAGLLQYAAAGAAEGIGQGLMQRSNSLRQAKREELRFQQQVALDDRRHAQAMEVMGQRQGFQAEEGRRDRLHQADENNLNRKNRTDLQTAQFDQQNKRDAGRYAHDEGMLDANQDFKAGENDKNRTTQVQVAGARARASSKITDVQYAKILTDAKKLATTKDRLSGQETLDPVAYAENLAATGIPLKPETIRSVQRGIKRQIRKGVKADAQGRKGGMFSGDDYGGMTEAEWVRDETERRTQQKLQEIGLTGQRAPSPPSQQNVTTPSGQGAPTAPKGSGKVPDWMSNPPSRGQRIKDIDRVTQGTLEAARQAVTRDENPLSKAEVEEKLRVAGVNPAWLPWWMGRYVPPKDDAGDRLTMDGDAGLGIR